MSSANEEPRVVPAQLDFLTVYNPTLSDSDETLGDQIVFYFSRRGRRQRASSKNGKQLDPGAGEEDEQNQRLRQVGLAQGMVNFAK